LLRRLPPDLQKNPKAYLYRAAVNQSLNLIRRRRREEPIANSERLEAPPSSMLNSRGDDVLHRRLSIDVLSGAPQLSAVSFGVIHGSEMSHKRYSVSGRQLL
jgi:DNA-directed RNA polymerase specialized sigma24 family protein